MSIVPKLNSYPTVTLSAEGDFVTVQYPKDTIEKKELTSATACKSHQEVLAFLLSFANTYLLYEINWRHLNSSYRGHPGPQLRTRRVRLRHACPWKDQITFVRARIEAARSPAKVPKMWRCCRGCDSPKN